MTATPAAPAVRRTLDRLADGREIIYFDDTEPYVSGSRRRRRRTPAPLEPAGRGRLPAALRRRSPGEWVAIASHRNDRTFLPPAGRVPALPDRSRRPCRREIPAHDYDVVGLREPVPLVHETADGDAPAQIGRRRRPLCRHARASAAARSSASPRDHDAVVRRPRAAARVRTVIEAWADRTAELSALPGRRGRSSASRTGGEEIGVTLHHPHGQIYAYPFVPPRSDAAAAPGRARTAGEPAATSCADVLDAERRAGTRVVLTGEHWTAYVPAAARWPVEVHLAPHRDVPDLAALDDAERDELAARLPRAVAPRRPLLRRRWPRCRTSPAWHQAPVGERPRRSAGCTCSSSRCCALPGKLKYLAGSESGMGAWVNDAAPERIAARLREVAS